MNKLYKTLFFASLLFFLGLTNTFCQSSTKEITDKFFSIYAKDPSKAIEYGFSTNKWMDRKLDAVTDLKNKLKNLIDLCGEYYGYEMLSETTAGENIKMVTFIVKYDREPIRFSFFFYKPKDKWQLNNFSYDEGIDEDLEEAAKAYRLKENMNW